MPALPRPRSTKLLAAMVIATLGASAVHSAPVARSFRLAVSGAPFFSGATIDSCLQQVGGPQNSRCTGGIADSELAARLYDRGLAPQLPPMNGSGAPPAGEPATLVEVMPPVFFPVKHDIGLTADGSGLPVNDVTASCGVLGIVSGDAPIFPSVNVLSNVSKLTECSAQTKILESVSLSRSLPKADLSSVVLSVDLAGGLLVLRSVLLRYLTTVALTQVVLKRISAAVDSGTPPISVMVILDGSNSKNFADFVAEYRKVAGEHSPLLHAIVNFVSEDAAEPVMHDGVWFFKSNAALPGRRLFLHMDLTVPLAAAPPGLGSALRVAVQANVPAAQRLEDATWTRANAVVDEWRARLNVSHPPIGFTQTDLIVNDGFSNGTCSFQDCAAGQMFAEALAFGPTPATDTLDRARDDSGTASTDFTVLANETVGTRTQIGFSMLAEFQRLFWPQGRITENSIQQVLSASTCRGELRGLTILRLIRASLSNRGRYFMQYSGLRVSYAPANGSLGRPDPLIVSVDVLDIDTGFFAPIQRTRLYSVATSNYVQLMDTYSPIMDNPLSGDAVRCFVLRERNLPLIIGHFVATRSPLNFTVQRVLTEIGEEDDPRIADAGAAGLLSTEDAAVCASRNAMTAAGAGVFYDADLLSCAPCPGHLVANPAADLCVAPPTLPPPPPPNYVGTFIGTAVGLVVALAASAAAALLLYPQWRRRHCPMDAAAPFTVVYVSTLNEGALRERHPVGTDRALRLIERVVSREAAAAGCVVAKRLEAHHMLVAKDPARALLCASAVLRTLDAADWTAVLLSSAGGERLGRIQQRRRHDSAETSRLSRETAAPGTSSSRPAPSGSVGSIEAHGSCRDLDMPLVAAGLWHGFGTIDHDDSARDAFGLRYGGAVAQCAAATAMKAAPWEVALPRAARVTAEDALWAAVGDRPTDLCDEDLLVDFDTELPAAFPSSAGSSAADTHEVTGSSDATSRNFSDTRLAPPQLGRAVFVAAGKLEGFAAVISDADGSRCDAARLETLCCNGLRAATGGGKALSTSCGIDHLSSTATELQRDQRGRAAQQLDGNALAAALSAASGKLASQRVGIICVYVPALRVTLAGMTSSAQTVQALFDPSAAVAAANRVTADDIMSAAAGAAVHSRLVALLDGCLYFAINAPQVTTAQVPARAAQDARAITAAVTSATGARASAGISMGAALVGAGEATRGEREGALKSRTPPVAVLGTAADKARTLARMAAAQSRGGGRPADHDESDAPSVTSLGGGISSTTLVSHSSAPKAAALAVVDAARSSVVSRSGLHDETVYQPIVLAAGDFAAELSGFELRVVDIVAWPEEVTCLMPPPRIAESTGAMAAGDVRRRVALAVQVVRDPSEAPDVDEGDEEWLYKIGAVGGKSPFSRTNAIAAGVVRDFGVAADFVAGNAPAVVDGDHSPPCSPTASPGYQVSVESRFRRLADVLARRTARDAVPEPGRASSELSAQQALISFAMDRFVDACFPDGKRMY